MIVDVVGPLRGQLLALSAEISRQIELFADDLGGAAETVVSVDGVLRSRLDAALAEVEECKRRVAAADRHREMFRHALWLFLQERDGPAGRDAPTPETLKMIRDLVEVLDGVA